MKKSINFAIPNRVNSGEGYKERASGVNLGSVDSVTC